MKRSVVRYCAASLCLGLLVWMVWQAGAAQLWHTLCQLPGTIALCVVIWGIGYVLNTASFRHVTRAMGGRQGYGQMMRLTIAGYALNYITPFGLLGGEPWRIMQLRPQLGGKRATRCVAYYAMMHVASHFCLWLMSLAVAMTSVPACQQLMEHPWAVCGVLALLLAVLVGWLWRKLPSVTFLWALLLELASRLVCVAEYWLVMQALGYASFGYVEALLVVAISSLVANVLFFSPLQMGTREGGILLALQLLLPGDLLPVAVTLSFATRVREFVWIAIGLALMTKDNKEKMI